jgi:hypothetical protein
LDYSGLLNLLWRSGHLAGCDFAGAAGERVVVTHQGEAADGLPGVWVAAEATVDGERRRGTVVVGASTPVPDGAMLRVVERAAPRVLGIDDRLVPQISYAIEPEVAECYDRLRRGAARCECAPRVAQMSPLHRTSLLTALLVERLERKYGDVMRVLADADDDWNRTFWVMLLRVMGGNRNREAYMSLASKVDFAMLSREKSSVQKIEALLLGGGGFLFAEESGSAKGYSDAPKDDYTLRLEDEFRHLAAKYSIVPLRPAVWDVRKLRAANFPTVRLAEIAALVAKKDFMLDAMLDCRTAKDVDDLFGVRASDYWDSHCKPGVECDPSPKRIGKAKTVLIGINLVAPLMFAYGRQTGRDELCDRALDLLGSLPAEENSHLAPWYDHGRVAESGFDSQALLQLWGEYCAAGRCAECRVGRAELQKFL